jgi:5-hydroxyisourate hydrolase-like protein (transthyretin family)
VPPILNDDGTIGTELQQFKAVNYTQLIPLLIAGFKEQQVNQLAQDAKYNEALIKLDAIYSEFEVVRTGSRVKTPQSSLTTALLRQNTPNPFDHLTEITYKLPEDGQVIVEIVDSSGRRLQVLTQATQSAGEYQLQWEATGYASGIYYCVIRFGTQVETVKLLKK